MAARPTWQGHLRLSLVTCPVALYKATEARTGVSFNLINPRTKSRVKQVLTDASTGEPIDRKELVKGFAIAKDEYVLIDPEEIDALKVESTKIIDIERFVELQAIDRIYWDEPYYLVPDGKTGIEAFAVIRDAMREKERVGLGRVVLSQRERTVALEPRDDLILLTTLRAHDEVRDPDELVALPKVPRTGRAMLDIADKIIEQQQGDFAPAQFVDRYEDAVRALIERKRKGQKPVHAEKPSHAEESNVVDLMEALRRSIGARPARRSESVRRAPRPKKRRSPKRQRKAA
ncbi:MAG: Ku protein [Alphaproteobacteria bacterium]|nr:Ku protein [Alphaproteobacteria bacterium]MCW5738947.1 Ku protein [Alphaproteobacteria bacterium]